MNRVRPTLCHFLISDVINFIIAPYLRQEFFIPAPICVPGENLCLEMNAAMEVQPVHSSRIPPHLSFVRNGMCYYVDRRDRIASMNLSGRELLPPFLLRAEEHVTFRTDIFTEKGILATRDLEHNKGIHTRYDDKRPLFLYNFWEETKIHFINKKFDFIHNYQPIKMRFSDDGIYMYGSYVSAAGIFNFALDVYSKDGNFLFDYVFDKDFLFDVSREGRLFLIKPTSFFNSQIEIFGTDGTYWKTEDLKSVISVTVDDWNQVLYLLYRDGLEIQDFFGNRIGCMPGFFRYGQSILMNKIV